MSTEFLRYSRIRSMITFSNIRIRRTSLWGFADQALLSLTNFIMMVLLARQLGPQAFGSFTIAYAVLLFANNIQGALFTQPHNVLAASLNPRDYSIYTSATALLQFAFSIVAGLFIAAVAWLSTMTNYGFGAVLLSVSATIVTWQSQEFLRRVFYTQGDFFAAFTTDLVTYGGQLIGVLILWRLDSLNATSAIATVAVSAACGSAVAIWRLRGILAWNFTLKEFRTIQLENWRFSRWLLLTVLATWLSIQLYPLLAAGLVGVAAAGGLRAARTLAAPATILVSAIDTTATSRAARIYHQQGSNALQLFIGKVRLGFGFILLVYLLVVALLAEPIVRLLMGATYTPYAWLVPVVAFSYAIRFLASTSSLHLRSAGHSSPLFIAQAVSAIFVLTLGVLSVYLFGLAGVALGMVANSLIASTVAWHFARKV